MEAKNTHFECELGYYSLLTSKNQSTYFRECVCHLPSSLCVKRAPLKEQNKSFGLALPRVFPKTALFLHEGYLELVEMDFSPHTVLNWR